MFDFLSWGHLLVLALGALFIFGPERLPTLARDAARGVKRLRAAMESMRAQVGDELGDDFAQLRDLDLRRYHPRTFIQDQLFGPDPSDEAFVSTTSRTPAPPARLGGYAQTRLLPPPFDRDAT